MILGEPLGLIALAGLPALVVLHLWRARHTPRPTSALFLWPNQRRVLTSGRRRAPLLLRNSFWCEVLAVLALAWWLADPHWSPRTPARHLAVVLDDRWRMQAVVGGDSAADRLRAALDARFARLLAGDRVTLIASGEPPRLLAGPAADPDAARRALVAWRPDAAWHGLDAAIALAAGLTGPAAEIIVGSDRTPAMLPPGVGLLATGRQAETQGIADARWWRDASGERIVAVVFGAHAPDPVLRIGELTLTSERLDGGMYLFAHLPPLAEDAVADLAVPGEDPLPIDNHVQLLRPAWRPLRAQVNDAMPGAGAARAALRACDATVVTDTPDLMVGNVAPDGVWSLTVQPGGGEPTLGPFTARREHPLLADVAFAGVLWVGGWTPTPTDGPTPDRQPLLIASGQVLISDRQRGNDHELVLHVDPVRAGLTRHSAWPGLFANLVAWRASRLPGVSDTNPRCGQPIRAVLPAGASTAELLDPSGGTARLHAGNAGDIALPGLTLPGLHSLRWPTGTVRISALPLDTRQADLAGATTSEIATTTTGQAQVERQRGALAALLPLVVAAAAAIAACVLFNREERA